MKLTRKERILKALEVDKTCTALQMSARLGIAPREALRCLGQLAGEGLIHKEKKPGYYTTYSLISNNVSTEELQPLAPKELKQPEPVGLTIVGGAFISINGSVGIDRILTLKRLRRNLIADYHPIIDMIIRDYETILHAFDQEDDD